MGADDFSQIPPYFLEFSPDGRARLRASLSWQVAAHSVAATDSSGQAAAGLSLLRDGV
jgi:hypothetical protein